MSRTELMTHGAHGAFYNAIHSETAKNIGKGVGAALVIANGLASIILSSQYLTHQLSSGLKVNWLIEAPLFADWVVTLVAIRAIPDRWSQE